MKKQFFALLLVFALLLAACGGSGSSKEKVSGTIQPVETETVAVEQLEEKPITLGSMEGGNYINSYAGFGCRLDSNWTFSSAEELQELPEEVWASMEGSKLAESVDVATQFMDMKADNADALLTINVVYSKLPLEERLALVGMEEAEYMEYLLGIQDILIESYAQSGMEVQNMEAVSVNFLGQERTALKTSSTIQEVPYYTLQLIYYDVGQFSVTLTLASYFEDNTESMLDLFYAVE